MEIPGLNPLYVSALYVSDQGLLVRRCEVKLLSSNITTSRDTLAYCFGFRHFIINESDALLDIGYRVSHASGINVERIDRVFNDYPGRWDSTMKVLTIAGQEL